MADDLYLDPYEWVTTLSTSEIAELRQLPAMPDVRAALDEEYEERMLAGVTDDAEVIVLRG